MLTRARDLPTHRPNAPCFVQGRAESLPFRDAVFDRLALVALLYMVADPYRMIAEVVRVLKPGGRVEIGKLGRWFNPQISSIRRRHPKSHN